MKTQAPSRESSYELLRIVSMLMIVAFHTFRYIDTTHFNSWQMFLFHCVRWYGLLGVNCYLLISAHFLLGRESHPRKLIPLIAQTFFYCALFLLCRIAQLCVTHSLSAPYALWQEISRLELDGLFSPLWANRYWFVTAYILFYLLLPALNRIIQNLASEAYRRMLLLLSLFLFLYLSFPQTTTNTGVVEDVLWISYVYLLAGYLRFHRQENWLKRHAGPVFLLLYLVFVLTRQLMTYAVHNTYLYSLLYHTTGNSMRYSFIMLAMALCVFYLFQRLHFQSALVNTLSSCTFGIYLFHENKVFHVCRLLADILYQPFLSSIPSVGVFMAFLVLLQFTAGAVVDLLRQALFQKLARFRPFSQRRQPPH